MFNLVPQMRHIYAIQKQFMSTKKIRIQISPAKNPTTKTAKSPQTKLYYMGKNFETIPIRISIKNLQQMVHWKAIIFAIREKGRLQKY